MANSVTQVCNRALQELGASRIDDITDDSRNGRACNTAYASTRDFLLRAHWWRFALARAQLAPTTTPPAFDFDYQFPLPADCLRIILPPDPYLDWQLEGKNILTNDAGPINLRYVAQVTDPNSFDPMFSEGLSLLMANNMCQAITQSNEKQKGIMAKYKDLIDNAKKVNCFERLPVVAEDDSWVLARNTCSNWTTG